MTINPDNTLTYTAPAGMPGSDVFTYVASDSQGRTKTATVTVTVREKNDPPVISFPQPASREQGIANVPLPRVLIADPDAGNGQLRLEVNVTGGTLTLGNPGLLAYSAGGDGIGDSQFTATGDLAALNQALAGSLFQPASANFVGTATVEFIVNDQGHTGGDGDKEDRRTMNFPILPLANPPGNVLIAVKSGDLVITGDGVPTSPHDAIQIELVQGTTYRVRSENGTKLNGTNQTFLDFPGVTRDIKIDLKQGNNRVEMLADANRRAHSRAAALELQG